MFNQDLEEDERLAKFFGVMESFNNNRPLDFDFKLLIEDHFKYKWEKDKNQALCKDEDLDILTQMPEHIQDQIYYKYLFISFINDFSRYFTFEKKFSKIKYNYYGWNDQVYRDFMVALLRALEPRKVMAGKILFNELDEFTEILYFNKGQVDIGFEINRKKFYALRRCYSIIIGDVGCTFNQDSEFIYRANSTCEGFSIRKFHWREIIDEFYEVSSQLKNRMVTTYFYQIKIKIMREKRQQLLKLKNRCDVHKILAVSDIDPKKDTEFLKDQIKQREIEDGVLEDVERVRSQLKDMEVETAEQIDLIKSRETKWKE